MSDEERRLREKAARCRRLALRASRTGKIELSDRLLRRADELDRLAGATGHPEPSVAPVHPFLGRAQSGGDAQGAATLDDEPEKSA
jgi:hypothetical protein